MSDINELIRLITNADQVIIFTGAGVSTNCGIPDYRGPQGVWKTRTPVYYQDFMAEEEARHRYWQMKAEDWEAFAGAHPSKTHQAIVQLHDADRLLLCATQNIDGLHLASGLPAEAVVELHGSNAVAECMQCGAFEEADPLYKAYLKDPSQVPACASCGGLLKPGVISFGQSLREADLVRLQERLFDADLIIAMGTTLSVAPAATFPLLGARQNIPYAVINRGPTEHDNHPLVSLRLDGDLDDIVPKAIEAALAFS